MTRLIYLAALLLLGTAANVYACGYDFVGGCSSKVSLKINGTEGSFVIAPCENSANFQGLQLGNLQSLKLSGAEVITWESCLNNVTAASLWYRVYKTGQTPGGWFSLNIPEDHNVVEGPYTTRYRDVNADLSLSNGLQVGSIYTLEVYIRADVDTLGDDFIPETFILQNNGGLNYKLQFTYGGAGAPPLDAVVTRDVDVDCWGKHTGKAGVTVFGGQTGGALFYQWSYNTQNFFEIDSLPAGVYTVTVTDNPSGNTATASIQITQPALPVMLNFTNVTSAFCNTPGSATVVTSGGTGPLSWVWSNGDTTQTTYFNTGGHYAITVTDSKGCTQKGMVTINGSGDIPVFELPVICSGEVYSRGNQTFTQEGLYSVTIPSPNGCDTIVDFYLNVIPSAELLAQLPGQAAITCLNTNVPLCAANFPGASYEWTKGGNILSFAPCILADEGGDYHISVITTEGNKTCTQSKTILVEEHTQPAVLTASGTGHFLPPCGSGNVSLSIKAVYPEVVASWSWTFNGVEISTTDTCSINLVQPVTAYPVVRVTDQYGCGTIATPDIVFDAPPGFPSITGATQLTQCNGEVEVNMAITGGLPPYSVQWSAGTTSGNPVNQVPGFYFVNATDANGCTVSVAVLVEDFSVAITAHDATGSGNADGYAKANPDGAFHLPLQFLWSNGATTEEIQQLLPGTYCVTVTDASGCTREDCAAIAGVSGVATQPFAGKQGLVLYPVPAVAGAEIYFPPFPEDVICTLINPAGIPYCQQAISAGSTAFHLPENAPPGVSFVEIKNQNYFRVGKIFLITGR